MTEESHKLTRGSSAFYEAGTIAALTPASAIPVRPLLPTQTDDVGPLAGGDDEQGELAAENAPGASEEIVTGEEEVISQRTLRTPYTPSASEVAQHRADGHNPYRDSCDDCNEAFGREAAHRDIHHDSVWVPIVSCDYMFLSARGVFHKDEWEPMDEETISRSW